jgi:hypothetical protein
MATRKVYSPKYDNDGNVKPSIPELTNVVENARFDAEDYKQQSQTARDDARAARDEALGAANDLGALGGVDGTAENKTGSSTLEKADGTTVDASSHSGEIWYVVGETTYYKSTGTDWRKTGPDLSNASRLTNGQVPDAQVSRSSVAQHAVADIASRGKIAAVDGNGNLVSGTGVVDPADYTSVASAIDDAAHGGNKIAASESASANGGGRVVHSLWPFDTSAVSWNPNVQMLPAYDRSARANPRGWGADPGDDGVDDTKALIRAYRWASTYNGTLARSLYLDGTYIVSETGIFDDALVEFGYECSILGPGKIKLDDNVDPSLPIVWVRDITSTDSISLDLRIDANGSNNATDVKALEVSRLRRSEDTKVVQVIDASVGVHLNGETEGTKWEIFPVDCGVGVEYGGAGGTPDENHIFIGGRGCDTIFKCDVSSTGRVIFEHESVKGKAVDIAGGQLQLAGEIRGLSSTHIGVHIDGGNNNKVDFSNLLLLGGGDPAIKVSDCGFVNGRVVCADNESGVEVIQTNDPSSLEVYAEGTNGFGFKGGDASNSITLRNFVLKPGSAFRNTNKAAVLSHTTGCHFYFLTNVSGGIDIDDSFSRSTLIFGEDAAKEGINLIGASVLPLIKVQFPTSSDGGRDNDLSPTRGTVLEYNFEDDLPNYYDGNDWRLPDGSVT